MSVQNFNKVNLVAWATFALTLCTMSVRGVWLLADMSGDVRVMSRTVKEIGDDLKSVHSRLDNLNERTTRIEERIHVSGEFHDHTKQ